MRVPTFLESSPGVMWATGQYPGRSSSLRRMPRCIVAIRPRFDSESQELPQYPSNSEHFQVRRDERGSRHETHATRRPRRAKQGIDSLSLFFCSRSFSRKTLQWPLDLIAPGEQYRARRHRVGRAARRCLNSVAHRHPGRVYPVASSNRGYYAASAAQNSEFHLKLKTHPVRAVHRPASAFPIGRSSVRIAPLIFPPSADILVSPIAASAFLQLEARTARAPQAICRIRS